MAQDTRSSFKKVPEFAGIFYRTLLLRILLLWIKKCTLTPFIT